MWVFNPAIADCGLQGTASSPSSTAIFADHLNPSNRISYNFVSDLLIKDAFRQLHLSKIQGVVSILSGAERARTADLYVANVSLSQLSYSPNRHTIVN